MYLANQWLRAQEMGLKRKIQTFVTLIPHGTHIIYECPFLTFSSLKLLKSAGYKMKGCSFGTRLQVGSHSRHSMSFHILLVRTFKEYPDNPFVNS